MTKNGTAALTINNSNTYSGGTSLNAGTLNINNGSAIGTGSLVIAASTTINNTSGSPVTLSTNNAQTWNGNFTFGGTTDLNLGTGSVTFTSTRTITVNGAVLTVGGNMNGGVSGLVKQGVGKLVLTGSNSYTGSTVLNQGTLEIAGGSTGVAGTDVQIAPNTTDAGTLVVSGGTLNAFRVIIGGASGNNTSPGTGVITQTGGTINSAAWFTVGSGGSAAGNTGGTGTYNISGGTLNLSTQQLEVANFTAASGAVNMNGGAINVGNSNFISMGANNNAGNGTFTQNAGAVTFYSDGGTTVGGNGILYLGRAGVTSSTYMYSLNGGTLTVPSVTRNGSNAANAVFNFNGGVLKAATNGAALMSNLTAANVQTNGAIIDTNGNSVSLPQPLVHDASGPALDGGFTKKRHAPGRSG